MMYIPYDERKEHQERLKRGLKLMVPNFVATLCYWCDGLTDRNFESCTACGEGRGFGCGLGLLVSDGRHSSPAGESVVNQVLVAADKETEKCSTPLK